MMNIKEFKKNIIFLYDRYDDEIFILLFIIASLLPIILIIKKLLFPIIKSYLKKRYENYMILIEKNKIFSYLLHVLISFYLILCSNIAHNITKLNFISLDKNILIIFYITISCTLLILSTLKITYKVLEEKTSDIMLAPLSLLIQISKILILSISSVIIIASILNISPTKFLTSLGAAAALLTFIFKDSVTGILSSIHIISQDMIRIGDHINIPSISLEGIVEEINITIIKIRNFDFTVSTIPTSTILNTNVINMRGIKERSAKKIQRAIHIDIESIHFINSTFLEKLNQSSHIINFENLRKNLIEENINTITNIKVFRMYITEYLRNNSKIYINDFTFVVRQLAPTITGLPIELFIFTNEINFAIYEDIQAEIFDHLLSILPEFNLKIFQSKY